jgi:hypothetical protein
MNDIYDIYSNIIHAIYHIILISYVPYLILSSLPHEPSPSLTIIIIIS